MAVVTPNDLPKSVRNRFVIAFFGGVLLSRCLLDFATGTVAFVIGLSQISSFFSSQPIIRYKLLIIYIRHFVTFFITIVSKL